MNDEVYDDKQRMTEENNQGVLDMNLSSLLLSLVLIEFLTIRIILELNNYSKLREPWTCI